MNDNWPKAQIDEGAAIYHSDARPQGHAVYVRGGVDDDCEVVGPDDPLAVAMAMTIEVPISGEVAMEFGDVLLQDGRVFGSTWRVWGDIMVARFGGHYMDYYMGDMPR